MSRSSGVQPSAQPPPTLINWKVIRSD